MMMDGASSIEMQTRGARGRRRRRGAGGEVAGLGRCEDVAEGEEPAGSGGACGAGGRGRGRRGRGEIGQPHGVARVTAASRTCVFSRMKIDLRQGRRQRLYTAGSFSPGWWLQPGLKTL